ncbi:phosphoribosylformylglycinamidine synthase II, partial [Thermococci archaeon]
MFSEVLDGVFKISVRGRDKEELLEISKVMNLGLDIEEMTRIRDYFSEIGRDPYDVELYGLAQAWSEHCSYKSSKRFLRKYLLSIGEVFLREDSGLREFDSEYYYVAAMESHNHPSAVEPYGGA